jgi:hypothetical protein
MFYVDRQITQQHANNKDDFSHIREPGSQVGKVDNLRDGRQENRYLNLAGGP